VDYATGMIYFGDTDGFLDKVDGATGTLVWRLKLGTGKKLHSAPLTQNGFVFIGNDAGEYFRVHDSGAGMPTAADVSSYPLCPGGLPCPPEWELEAAAGGDLNTQTIYIPANGVVFEFPMGAGAWQPSGSQSLNTPGGAIVYSSPMVDG